MKQLFGILAAIGVLAAAPQRPAVTQGTLITLARDGQPSGACPLKHTGVKAEISGPLTRVTVTQEFHNPYPYAIEAVYTFPLSHRGAVDNMTMKIGARVIKGVIKRREEARAIYEAARRSGRTASLLDQERPNIFTQAVANIPPGARIDISISYVETLSYEDGVYEFAFPMVVGPRYIPGQPVGRQGGGWSPDTNRVPDASRITPPVTPPGTRAGHDISVEVTLDAGLPIDSLKSGSHEIDVTRPSANQATVRLKDKDVIPNKDFLLKFDVAGQAVRDAVLVHRGARGGFFTLLLAPPERVNPAEITPKELVFVLDTSGSMSGFPIEKAKETMRLALDGLNPRDTFNLITFAGDTYILFPQPVPATAENLRRAQEFLASRSGRGGTEMMKAVRAALDGSGSQEHIRVVCFMTDGYVGNEAEILSEIQRHENARVFSFGIGGSVNRHLLDKMAEYGRGEVEYVSLQADGSAAAKRFHERVRNPLLTDVTIDWAGLPVSDIYPKRIPDLFSAKPVIISGRFSGPARGTLRLQGKLAGREFTRNIRLDLPAAEPRHDVLATLWARTRIDHLMGESSSMAEITQLGLEYRLMTAYTSFVAVEETIVNTDGGPPRRIEVPVEMPEGVDYRGVFGEGDQVMAAFSTRKMAVGGLGGGANASLPLPRTAETVTVHAEPSRAVVPRPAPAFSQKLDPQLRAIVERLPRATERSFVKNGKAEIQVWLADTSPATLAALKALGFEIVAQPKSGRIVVGRLPVDKLKQLAELAVVIYAAPIA